MDRSQAPNQYVLQTIFVTFYFYKLLFLLGFSNLVIQEESIWHREKVLPKSAKMSK